MRRDLEAGGDRTRSRERVIATRPTNPTRVVGLGIKRAYMSVGTFMDILEKQGVTFDLVAEALRVEVPLGVLSEGEPHELAARRAEIESLVRVALAPSQPEGDRVAADDRQAQIALGQVA